MGKIVDLLLLVIRLAQDALSHLQTMEQQKELDALHDDPGAWLCDHFNSTGMLDDDIPESTSTKTADND
jgi:hypothetical protein